MRKLGWQYWLLILALFGIAIVPCTWADSEKSFTFDLSVGGGFLAGDTTYQIGGAVSTADGERFKLHFPLSELEFPLDTWWVTLNAEYALNNKFEIAAAVMTNVTDDPGKTKDSDWGVAYLESGYGSPTTLDIYSESETEMDGLIADVVLRYRFYRKPSGFSLAAGIGWIHENFDFTVSDLHQWYPSLGIYEGDRVAGEVGKYEVTYDIPYLELSGKFEKANYNIAASFGFSPIVQMEDEDQHLLRGKVNKGDGDGDAIIVRVEGNYFITTHIFIGGKFSYMSIDTEGEHEASFYGVYDHTIDLEASSDQTMALVELGYRF